MANTRDRGAQLLDGLRGPAAARSAIGDVRGLGCMVAMEFVKPGQSDERVPDPELTGRVIAEALDRRLIILSAGSYAQVTRIMPPLVTTAEVDTAVRILEESPAAGP